MEIFGHAHTYQHTMGDKSVIVGIGGAPLSGSSNYGYVIASRRADGAIEFTGKDITGAMFDHFVVQPDGTPTP
jgi:hypothetical protein